MVALLPGAKRPDEAIVYMAHWDHLGNARRGRDAGDNIYNGAIDNATGVAGILEIAEAFAKQTPPPERSLLFLAVTLEESGLLGSKYYVAHPTVPLDKTVAVINLDAMPVIGQARDMTVVGLRQFASSRTSSRRSPTSRAACCMPKRRRRDGFYFRSDHFNFAKAGVPALYAKGGDDLVEGGTDAGRKRRGRLPRQPLPQAGDEFDPDWKLDGVVQDLDALYGVGRELAGSEQWPNWYEGNAFRAAQEKLRTGAASRPRASGMHDGA